MDRVPSDALLTPQQANLALTRLRPPQWIHQMRRHIRCLQDRKPQSAATGHLLKVGTFEPSSRRTGDPPGIS
jgi:hypothetical protein